MRKDLIILKEYSISPQSGFEENVFGENKLHIQNQHDELPPSRPNLERVPLTISEKKFNNYQWKNTLTERKKFSSHRIRTRLASYTLISQTCYMRFILFPFLSFIVHQIHQIDESQLNDIR
jgi:hypothetical protein